MLHVSVTWSLLGQRCQPPYSSCLLPSLDLKSELRYIVSHGAGLNPSIVSAVLSDQLPGVKVKSGADEATPDKIDGSRLRALGLELRSKYETVVDMASALIALKIVQLPAS